MALNFCRWIQHIRNVKIFFLDKLRVKLFLTQTLYTLNQPALVLCLLDCVFTSPFSLGSTRLAGLVFGLQLLQCLLKRSAFLSLIHLVLGLFCGCCYFLYFGLEFINRVCLFMLPWARLLCQCFTAKVTVLLQAVVVTLHSHFMKCVDVLYITSERVNIIDQLFFLICPSTS